MSNIDGLVSSGVNVLKSLTSGGKRKSKKRGGNFLNMASEQLQKLVSGGKRGGGDFFNIAEKASEQLQKLVSGGKKRGGGSSEKCDYANIINSISDLEYKQKLEIIDNILRNTNVLPAKTSTSDVEAVPTQSKALSQEVSRPSQEKVVVGGGKNTPKGEFIKKLNKINLARLQKYATQNDIKIKKRYNGKFVFINKPNLIKAIANKKFKK